MTKSSINAQNSDLSVNAIDLRHQSLNHIFEGPSDSSGSGAVLHANAQLQKPSPKPGSLYSSADKMPVAGRMCTLQSRCALRTLGLDRVSLLFRV